MWMLIQEEAEWNSGIKSCGIFGWKDKLSLNLKAGNPTKYSTGFFWEDLGAAAGKQLE